LGLVGIWWPRNQRWPFGGRKTPSHGCRRS
jgi:hypothetical protein